MRTAPDRFPWKHILTGIVVYLALQVICVGVASFAGSSEAREAHVVDVILREGTWVLPLRNGVVPSKPPLYHWVTAVLSTGMGGVTELSARLSSHLFAALCLILVSLIAYRLALCLRTFQGGQHASRAALLSAGILSLTYGFYQMGCQAMVDMTFAACVWSSLASLVLGLRFGDVPGTFLVHPLGRSLFWFFAFLGVLARGPLGLLLPVALAGVAAWCLLGLRRAIVECTRPSLGWCAVALPGIWYASAYRLGGEAFLERQIFFENIKRFSGGEFVNSEAWWFYIPSLLRTTFPWGVVLVVLCCAGLRNRATVSYPGESRIARWLPTIVLTAGVLLLSLSSGKRHSYTLPLVPLVAIQLGLELSTLFERGEARQRQRLIRVGRGVELGLAGAFLSLVLISSLAVASGRVSSPWFLEGFSASAEVVSRMGAIVLCYALIVFVSVRRTPRAACCSVWFLMLVVMTTIVAVGTGIKAHFKGFDQMGRMWLATMGEGEHLAAFKHRFDEYLDPLLFYVRRPVRLVDLEDVGRECADRTVYVAKKGWLNQHERLIPGSIVRVLEISERLKSRRDSDDKTLVFFRCSSRGEDSVDVTKELREAAVLTDEHFSQQS